MHALHESVSDWAWKHAKDDPNARMGKPNSTKLDPASEDEYARRVLGPLRWDSHLGCYVRDRIPPPPIERPKPDPEIRKTMRPKKRVGIAFDVFDRTTGHRLWRVYAKDESAARYQVGRLVKSHRATMADVYLRMSPEK